MTLHTGDSYIDGAVCVGAPDMDKIRTAPIAEDVFQAVKGGLAWALRDKDVYYFSIYHQGKLIGQIYLHDIDWQSGVGMLGYHLFQPDQRGQGIGTKTLELLQKYVTDYTDLTTLIIITGRANTASCRMAKKCGFEHIGTAREDSNNVVYRWNVPR